MTASREKQLIHIFKQAAASGATVQSDHVVDDDELLTCWSLGQLPPAKHEAVLAHLASCDRCRGEVAHLIRAGVLTWADEETAPTTISSSDDSLEEIANVLPTYPPENHRRFSRINAATIAAAAALLIAFGLWWANQSDSDPPLLAQAEQQLQAGRADLAMQHIEELLAQSPSVTVRRRAAVLFETAAYSAATRHLAGGDFSRVNQIEEHAAKLNARSARLANLQFQAEVRTRFEFSLASADKLLDYGLQTDGGVSREPTRWTVDEIQRRNQHALELLSEYPEDLTLRLNYGQFLLQIGRLEEAAVQFERVLIADPQSPLATAGLGIVRYQQDRFGDAYKLFQAFVEKNPSNSAAHLNLAMTLERLGRPEDARIQWKEAKKWATDSAVIQQIDSRLEQLP